MQGVTPACFFIRLFVSKNDAAFCLCFICEHCVVGQVRVSFELINRPFWSNLDPKPCCEELLGCSRDLRGDKLLNSGPLEAQGEFHTFSAFCGGAWDMLRKRNTFAIYIYEAITQEALPHNSLKSFVFYPVTPFYHIAF